MSLYNRGPSGRKAIQRQLMAQLGRPATADEIDAELTRHKNRRANNIGGTKGRGHHLTDAERAEIARRLRRFEKPVDLAREYGVTAKTVRGCIRDGAA